MAKTTQQTTESNVTAFTPVIKKQLNFPVLSQKEVGSTICVLLLTGIHTSKSIIDENPNAEKKEKPSDICIALDLATGELVTVLISAVEKGLLEEHYPDGSYVGVSFMMCNKGKRAGKKYNDIEMTEIETPEDIDVKSLLAKIPSA